MQFNILKSFRIIKFTILLLIFIAFLAIIFFALKVFSSSESIDDASYEAYPTGWVTQDGKEVYIDKDYSHATGWKEIDGEKYYFDEDGHALTGASEIDGTEYYFDKDGKLMSGWATVKGKKIYLSDEGTIYSGWVNILGESYYIMADGSPAKGRKTIRGRVYTFSDEGRLITKDDLMKAINALPYTITETDNKKTEIKKELTGIGGYEPDFEDRKVFLNLINDISNNGRYSLGFIAMDLYTGEGIAYNPDESIYSASSIKGPYVACLVESQPELTEKLESSFKEIIINSDNKIYQSVRRTYGNACFKKWCDELGLSENINVEMTRYNYTHFSTRDLAKLWLNTYFFLDQNKDGQKIREWFESPNNSAIHPVFEEKNYITETKGGWIAKGGSRLAVSSTVDAGVVYPDKGHPFMIIMLSNIPSDMEELCPLAEALGEMFE